jgi:hypothetical protein
MSVMNHLADAAAALLLLELLLVVTIFAVLCGGLAFGLYWVNGKTEWAFGLLNGLLPPVRKYASLAMDVVAKPFILLGTWTERIEATVGSLQRQIAAVQASKPSEETAPVPAEPVQPPIDPLV